MCERTGLAGFLWDSYSNLGWWQLDYSKGTMRPQHDRMTSMFANLVNAGLRIWPEAMVAFSNYSCVGMVGGNHYGEPWLAGYGYNTTTCIPHEEQEGILTGKLPLDALFRVFAHRRIPSLHFHTIPREEWDPQAVTNIKELIAVYRTHRTLMKRRTVLKDDQGVLWENGADTRLFFSFQQQPMPFTGEITDAATGQPVTDGQAQKNRAYIVR